MQTTRTSHIQQINSTCKEQSLIVFHTSYIIQNVLTIWVSSVCYIVIYTLYVCLTHVSQSFNESWNSISLYMLYLLCQLSRWHVWSCFVSIFMNSIQSHFDCSSNTNCVYVLLRNSSLSWTEYWILNTEYRTEHNACLLLLWVQNIEKEKKNYFLFRPFGNVNFIKQNYHLSQQNQSKIKIGNDVFGDGCSVLWTFRLISMYTLYMVHCLCIHWIKSIH